MDSGRNIFKCKEKTNYLTSISVSMTCKIFSWFSTDLARMEQSGCRLLAWRLCTSSSSSTASMLVSRPLWIHQISPLRFEYLHMHIAQHLKIEMKIFFVHTVQIKLKWGTYGNIRICQNFTGPIRWELLNFLKTNNSSLIFCPLCCILLPEEGVEQLVSGPVSQRLQLCAPGYQTLPGALHHNRSAHQSHHNIGQEKESVWPI